MTAPITERVSVRGDAGGLLYFVDDLDLRLPWHGGAFASVVILILQLIESLTSGSGCESRAAPQL